jgi:hypothetical protein
MSNFGRLWQYQSIERKDQTIVPLNDSALVFNTLNIAVQVADVLRKVGARSFAFDYSSRRMCGGRTVMHRTVCRISIAALCGWAALIAADGVAFAQAGSIGGTIGKTDKSVSGVEQAEEPRDRKPSAEGRAKARPSRHPESARIVGPKTFQNPAINGIRIDGCLANLIGDGCGTPAADAWCRSKGMSRAISSINDTASPTYRQGDHSICRKQPCSAFAEIVCE